MVKVESVENSPGAGPFVAPRRIGLIGVHPEQHCSAGAFTRDLRSALIELPADIDCFTMLACGSAPGENYGALLLKGGDDVAYRRALNYLCFSDIDAVSLQYDPAAFAGAAGAQLLDLLRRLAAPVVTTLHDIPLDPMPEDRRKIGEIVHLSASVVVMAAKGAAILADDYDLPAHKIHVLPCGIPERPPLSPVTAKAKLGAGGRTLLMTAGMLAPDKGLEVMIEALRTLVPRHPDMLYLVVGETNPALFARDGERYRESLVELAAACGVADHIRFIGRPMRGRALCEALTAADIYVSPYLSEGKIASHTLASAFGIGKPVVATPFWFAQELLANDAGLLVPFGNPERLADAIHALLGDRRRLNAMRRRASAAGRKMLWPRVARRHYDLLALAVRHHAAADTPDGRDAAPAADYPRIAVRSGSAVTG